MSFEEDFSGSTLRQRGDSLRCLPWLPGLGLGRGVPALPLCVRAVAGVGAGCGPFLRRRCRLLGAGRGGGFQASQMVYAPPQTYTCRNQHIEIWGRFLGIVSRMFSVLEIRCSGVSGVWGGWGYTVHYVSVHDFFANRKKRLVGITHT